MELKFTPHWSQTGKRLSHSWAPIGNVDQFRWLSRADMQRQLVMARDELGVRHVRAELAESLDQHAPTPGNWAAPAAPW